MLAFIKHNKRVVVLNKVRAIEIVEGAGKSAIRFTVVIDFEDGTRTSFNNLTEEESERLFEEIIEILKNAKKVFTKID